MQLQTKRDRKEFAENVGLITLCLAIFGGLQLLIWWIVVTWVRYGLMHQGYHSIVFFSWSNLQYLVWVNVGILTIFLIISSIIYWVNQGEE